MLEELISHCQMNGMLMIICWLSESAVPVRERFEQLISLDLAFLRGNLGPFYFKHGVQGCCSTTFIIT